MTQDPSQPEHPDRRPGNAHEAGNLPLGSAPVPASDLDPDDADLRRLFRATAPTVRPIDVEALFTAAEASRPRPRRLFPVASPERSFWKRSLSMSLRIAAGLLIATGIAGVATLLVPRESAAYVTLAEVQAKVERTRTLTCTMTDQTSSPAKKESELHRLLTLGPSLVRLENADHTYTITDYEHHKALLVDPAHKSVRVLEGFAIPNGAPAPNVYELFRSIAANPIKTLPPREIAGKSAVGFVVRNPPFGKGQPKPEGPEPEITVWVNPQTKLPLRIEMTSREGNVTASQVFTDIVFDRPLDPALFDLNPPAGYRVETFGVAQLRPAPAAKEAAELIVTPLEGIGPVKFGMKTDQVINLLGPPDKIIKPVKDQDVLEYYSRGFSIHAHAQRGVLMIMCYTGKFMAFKVRDFAGRIDKGIRMRASRAAIEKAYGPPSSVREATNQDVFGKQAANPEKKTGQVDLSYNALRLTFSLHDDALDSITILFPRPVANAPAQPKPAGAAPKL
jgi:outer membrane lipoprotein-sorting protein